MTIAQSATIQAYQLRKDGTPPRMAILRMIAADSVNNRNERDAHDCDGGPDHTGWFCDVDRYEKAIGIVASLSHNRFIAGYRWTSNDERVYFEEVFTDENAAARMADEHARIFAESAREDSEKYDAAQKLEIDTEDATQRLRECLVLRRTACMRYVRDEIAVLLETIRSNRDTLRTEYANYI